MATRRADDEGQGGDPARSASWAHRTELDDWLNARLYHPAAARLAAALARTPATPNAVSAAGGLLIVAAGALYAGLSWPVAAGAGFLAHALWHVVDGADGDLARRTGRASPTGEMVDGLCDYSGHAILYVFLATIVDDSIGGWAWALGWAAGISRVFQANHAESQRRTYLWRVCGVPWLKQVYQTRDSAAGRGAGRLFEPLARAYVALASAGSPLAAKIDRLVGKTASEGARDRARRICREESRLPLKLQSLLGANGRTIALGLSMAAGSPLWYWLLEVSLLNLLLLASLLLQRRCDRRIAERLEGNAVLLGA